MTEEGKQEQPGREDAQPAPAEPEQRPRRLYRSNTDKVLAGVAGGLGRYFNVDPVLFRIGFAALTLFGGVGFVLYGAAWLFVPDEDGGSLLGGRGGGSRALTIAGAVVIALAFVSLLANLGDGGWGWGWWGGFLGPLLIIAIIGALVWRYVDNRRQVTGDASSPPDARERPGVNAGWLVGRIALVIAIVAASALLFFGSAIAAAAGGGAVIAAVVIAVGALLVVAAFRGGARWLIIPALLLAFPVGVVSAADVDLDGGIGEKEYHPTSVAELRDSYQLGIGRLEVDLRDVELPPGDHSLRIDQGVGEAIVVVPRDVCVALDSQVGGGYSRLLDRDSAGLDVDWDVEPTAPARTPRLLIDAKLGFGQIQVVHDPGDVNDHEGRWDNNDVSNSDGNDACDSGRR